METKLPAAPWRCIAWDDDTREGAIVAADYTYDSEPLAIVKYDNHKLVSLLLAAPEMLDALQQTARLIEQHWGTKIELATSRNPIAEVYRGLLPAIARAKGGA